MTTTLRLGQRTDKVEVMAKLRGEERWAAACMTKALPGVEVLANDDGSRPSMHDLDLVREGQRFGAVEVTAAADSGCIELWNLINGRGKAWHDPRLAGRWIVALTPDARVQDLRKQLPDFLLALEQDGSSGFRRLRQSDPLRAAADALGVAHTSRFDSETGDSINFTIEQPAEKAGGWVAPHGNAMAEWIGPWMASADQEHNLKKLANSHAEERHLFVILPGFTTAPFTVAQVVLHGEVPPILTTPVMPEEISHVWIMSTWRTPVGVRWSPGDGWTQFEKVWEV